MTLTNTQVSQIRLLSTDANPPFLVSPEELNILYDQASSDTNTTVYNVMALMRTRLAAKLLQAGDKPEASWLNKQIDLLCERMKSYEDKYGIGSTMSVGTADLGIDSDLDSESVSTLPSWWYW